MANGSVTTRILTGFHDPSFTPQEWNRLLAQGETDVVFLTWEWQCAWWEAFGRGELKLIVAERSGQPIALAPLFFDGGMFFLVGSGGSDYLDFVGDIGEPEVLDALLTAVCGGVTGFVGFRFYHVPDASNTGARLTAAAARLGLSSFDEGELAAPALEIAAEPEHARECLRKKSLLRHEAYFRSAGELEVDYLQDADAILACLPDFFEQHVERWSATAYPSLFLDPAQRDFYARLTRAAAPAGWLRFTRIGWNGRVIAFHFGFFYRGSYLWYKPTFAIDLARRSPGEVLLRQLLFAALEEHAEEFDFGLGDEAFKQRFATRTRYVRTWGLYPEQSA